MGIVTRQSLYNSIASYLGIIIGAVNTLVLFPRIFTADEFGLTRVIAAAALMSATVFSFGLPNTTLKFFPDFRDKANKHNGILFFILLVTFIGFFLFLVATYFFKDDIIANYSKNSPLFGDYFNYIIVLSFYLMFMTIFDVYLTSLFKSVLFVFMQNIVLRLLWTILILLYYFKQLNFDQFIFYYVNANSVVLIVEIVYAIYLKELFLTPNLKQLDRKTLKSIGVFAFFVILGASSSMLSKTIDSLMIGGLVKEGFKNVAFYSVALYIGVMITVPYNGIVRIANSLIASYWKDNDTFKIDQIYKQTSNNLMLIGTLLFLGIWLNADNIFQLLPEDYSEGKYVLLFVCLAQLFEVSTGVNASIIQFSKFYKLMLYFNAALIILLILTNYLFIPIYGITGAALATFITIFFINTSRLILIKLKMGILPFTKKSILTPVVGIITYLIVVNIPEITPFYIDIVVRSFIITILFVPTVYYFKVSEEFNQLINNVLQKIKLKK